MTMVHLCPKCGRPTEGQGEGLVRCFHCKRTMRIEESPAAEAETEAAAAPVAAAPVEAAPAAEEIAPAVPETALMQAAFCLGVLALMIGVVSCIAFFLPRGTGLSRIAAWGGVLLGGGTVILAIVRDECAFAFPFAGLSASVLTLSLLTFVPGTPERRDGGGPGGGGPGWMGGGPGDFRGGGPGDFRGGGPRDR
jgi:uncharacterized membrane protein YgcG